MATRERDRAAVRGRILEATLDELVAAEGDAVTMQNIAVRADVALRTLYNHFADRDHLLAATFAHHGAQTRADIEALRLADACAQAQLDDVVDAYYARYRRMGARLSTLLSLRGYPELEEQIRAIRDWRRRLMRGIIARAEQEESLVLPAQTAVVVAFTMTSHACWRTMLEATGGAHARTTQAAKLALGSALFHHQPNADGRRS
jgi:AcrR family transcriptional regulator